MIQKGIYRARAAEWQLGFAETGTEQVAISFEILEEGEAKGHRIHWFGFFTDATAERSVKALRTCGWEGEDLADLRGLDRNEVELEIAHETYQGKVQAKVKWVNAVGGNRVVLKRQMSDAQKAVLAKRLKGLVIATKRASPPASAHNGSGKPGGGYPENWDGF